MKKTKVLFLILVAVSMTTTVLGADAGNTMNVVRESNSSEIMPNPDSAMLGKYLRRLATGYLSAHRQRILAMTSTKQWESERKRLLASYRGALGSFPKKTPLNVRIVDRIEKPDVTIEKIIFESRPKFYVTANLYLPNPPRAERCPTVLLLCGHYPLGKADPLAPHQLMGLTLAKRGFITFAVDPPGQGERQFYVNDKGALTVDLLSEHCYYGYQCLLTGSNSMQYFMWDAIRAVDYLLGRPEVDPKRIAVTGVSGGGTQTLALGPLEPRVNLIAPTCYVTSRLRYLGNAADAEQCWFGAIKEGLDHSTLIEMVAPKPFQAQAAIQDFFPIEGTRESVSDAKHVYKLYGAENRLNLVEDNCNHQYSPNLRKAFYSWFSKWFDGDTGTDEPEMKLMKSQELSCTTTGKVKTAFSDSRWIADFNRDRAKAVAPKRTLPKDKAALSSYQKSIRKVMKDVLQADKLDKPTANVKSPRQGNTETVWICSEPGITVPVIISYPAGDGKHPAVLLIEETGSNISVEGNGAIHQRVQQLRGELASQGYVAMTIDVRGTGASSPSAAPHGELDWIVGSDEAIMTQDAFMCGTSIFSGRLRDAMQSFEYLRERPEVDSKHIAVLGWGQGGLIALSAAALDSRITACAAIGSLAAYRCLVEADKFAHPPSTFLWDVLSHYDLPEAAACVAPRSLLLAGPVGAMKEPLPTSEAVRLYDPAMTAYRTLGVENALTIGNTSTDISKWLQKNMPARY